MRALVVFHGQGKHWLARFLKPGFTHVGFLLAVGDYWVCIDPGIGTPDVQVPAASSSDLASYYRAKGWHCVEVETGEIEAVGPFTLNTCVGVTKKFLGIRNPFIWTPFQLYKYISNKQNREWPND